MTRLSRTELRGSVQTVLGLIEPSDLGNTLLHEHILCDIRPPSWHELGDYGKEISLCNHWPINYGEVIAPGNLQLDERAVAIDEVGFMKRDGGNAIVDLSCGGLDPNPAGLSEVSKATGVHIIMGCGQYVDEYQDPANAERTIESFAQEMVDQVCVGAWGTDIRSGIIGEIGCQSPWTPLEKKVMEGAAIAMEETGASLSVHPGRHKDQPQEVADFLAERGAPMDRVIMSHIDRTIFDDESLFRLADTGCIIELDLFGMESSYYKLNEEIDMPNDGVRLKVLCKLKDRGHLGQIAISHDICYRTRLSTYGGHGYGHIFRNVVPMMKRRGFSEADVNTILVETPKRLLTFA
jgi:phosphotriesterase-related protein